MFYVLEHFLIMLDKDHWAADNLDQVKGIYVIFLPFFPCLLWSLNMARIQKRDGVKVKVRHSEERRKASSHLI